MNKAIVNVYVMVKESGLLWVAMTCPSQGFTFTSPGYQLSDWPELFRALDDPALDSLDVNIVNVRTEARAKEVLTTYMAEFMEGQNLLASLSVGTSIH